jgi:hypothetical protein
MTEPDQSPGSDPRWELAQRVAGSKTFARSPSLRRFLLFVCESSLQGQAGSIKEQQIGYRVLGRAADYNAAEDNIVRVRARELRRKLEEFFAEEGKDESMVILLPKGGYVPVFQPRDGAEQRPAPAANAWSSARLPWLIAAALALLCAGLIVRDMRRPPVSSAAHPAAPHDAVQRIWSQLIRPGEETLVVAADANFIILQDLARQNVPLEEYMRQKFMQRAEFKDPALVSIANRQNTGIGEVNVLLRILRMNPETPGRIRFRFARDLEVRDLKNGSAILMGARRSNPWVELFEPRLHYVFRWDARRNRSYIENRSARPGAPSTFETQIDGKTMVSYATIAFLPNLSQSGHVLLISGLRTEGTEAAGEMVTVPDACERLLRAAGFGPKDPMRPFEALIQLTSLGGASSNLQILAARRIEH